MSTGAGRLIPSPDARERAVRILFVAIWFGLATGLVEVCIFTFQKLILHEIIKRDQSAVWMVPLAELLFFIVPGVVFASLSLRWPRLVSPRIAVFVLAFLSFAIVVLYVPRLHKLAALLLAVGLATQAARTIAAHPEPFHRFARRTTAWMALIVLALGLALQGREWLSERRTLARLPPPPPAASNVLLIVLDTVRAQSLSLYGYERATTPHLEQLARTGVRFEWALSTAPWTTPAHSTLFTGHWPHELSADWRTPLDHTYATLAEVFSRHGYKTAGFVANTIYAGWEYGLDRGFAHFEDYPLSLGQLVKSALLSKFLLSHRDVLLSRHSALARKSASTVNKDFLEWLDGTQDRPFFVFLNYMDAHSPYAPPPPFDTQFRTTKSPSRNALQVFAKSGKRTKNLHALTDTYDGSIAFLDQQVDRLLAELRARGKLDNTLVIVTSDHGEQLGEHALLRHGNSLYIQLLRVPLLMSLPQRLPQGLSVAEFVTLRDLPATMLDVTGVENEALLPGRSLTRFWEGDSGTGREGEPQALLSEVSKGIRKQKSKPVSRGDMKSLALNGLHYIKNGDGVEELYDLKVDRAEERDLAGLPERRAGLLQFRALLPLSLVGKSAVPKRP